MIDESVIESAVLDYLESLGYATLQGGDIAPTEPAAEREAYADVLLADRLRLALRRLNPYGCALQAAPCAVYCGYAPARGADRWQSPSTQIVLEQTEVLSEHWATD